MFPLSRVVKDILVAAGLGTFAYDTESTTYGIYVGGEPGGVPSRAITITDIPNGVGVVSLAGDMPDKEGGVQVLVRSRAYLDGYDKIIAARDALLAKGRFTQTEGSDTVTYPGFFPTTDDVLFLGKDPKQRFLFSLNFRARRRLS